MKCVFLSKICHFSMVPPCKNYRLFRPSQASILDIYCQKLFFNDEQKNPDFLEQPNYSKMKTPFKLRNRFLESNRKNFPKTKIFCDA